MASGETTMLLMFTAAAIAFTHTLMGPDHYLPFIVMARAGRWSRLKTYLVAGLCGVGHVLSSVMLGAVGIGIGVAINRIEYLESVRGEFASWALIAFGVTYGVWGLHRALRDKKHMHDHVHVDGVSHAHEHGHHREHAHVHVSEKKALTPWVLFAIFVLGPCEPLIPLLMVPAASSSYGGMWLIAGVFGVVTIATMLGVVAIGLGSVSLLRGELVERYAPATAGFMIAVSGVGIRALGI